MNDLGQFLREQDHLLGYIALLLEMDPDGPYDVVCLVPKQRVLKQPVRFRDARSDVPKPDRGELFAIGSYNEWDVTIHLAATFIAKKCARYGRVKIRDLVYTPVGDLIYPHWLLHPEAAINFTKQPLVVVRKLIELLKVQRHFETRPVLTWTSWTQHWFIDPAASKKLADDYFDRQASAQ